jgi:hypothetical protein
MNFDIPNLVLFGCNMLLFWLSKKTTDKWGKAEIKYHAAEIGRIGAAGELECLRKLVEQTSPEMLEFHDKTMMELQARLIINEGVKK